MLDKEDEGQSEVESEEESSEYEEYSGVLFIYFFSLVLA